MLAGQIVAGPHVRNACRRHLLDLDRGPARGLRWDLEDALHVVNFFPVVCRLAGGQFEGEPFELDPSQAFIVGSLFGWKKANGFRRFRRAYIEEGKGNGKSPLAAGIGLYGLVADDEERAEIYAAAADRDQAMVLFRDADAMVNQSPALSREILKTGVTQVRQLTHMASASFFKPLSREKKKKGSGPRPHFALCDEVHEHPDRDIIDTLERGFKFREQPLLLMTTNSGSDRNSVCWEEHEHAVKCAAGVEHLQAGEIPAFKGDPIDDDTFAFVCGLDDGDQPLNDPSCWPKANPLLGKTITQSYLEGVVRQAKAIPGKRNGILRLHFCEWTDADMAWMSREALEAVLADFDPADHSGEKVAVGADLSATTDLTAQAYCVQTGTVRIGARDLPTYDAWIDAWSPKDTLRERAEKDRAPYEQWVDQGHLTATPGKIIRLGDVAARLAEVAAEYVVIGMAYDRYGFKRYEEECANLGLTVEFHEHPQGGKRRARPSEGQIADANLHGEEAPQGLWMPGSVKVLEELILEGRIRLRRNPVLVSACMSAVTDSDAFDNRWFDKRKAVNRIDALVALAMAVGLADQKKEVSMNLDDFLAKPLYC